MSKAKILTMSGLAGLIFAAMPASAITFVGVGDQTVQPTLSGEGATASPGGTGKNEVCPQTYTFTFTLNAAKAGTFTYSFVRSDGFSSPVQIKTVSAGNFTVTNSWVLGVPGGPKIMGAWVGIKINNSSEQHLSTFSFSCALPLPIAPSGANSGA